RAARPTGHAPRRPAARAGRFAVARRRRGSRPSSSPGPRRRRCTSTPPAASCVWPATPACRTRPARPTGGRGSRRGRSRPGAPAGAVAGDVMLATLGFGSSSATAQPALTAPAGWTLVNRTNKDPVASLAVYRHVFAAGETTYTWTTSIPVGGTAFIAAFAGVD